MSKFQDAAVLIREDFKPDPEAATDTLLKTRMLLLRKRYAEALRALDDAKETICEIEDAFDKLLEDARRSPVQSKTEETKP